MYTKTIDELLATDNWELARQTIAESPVFAAERDRIEDEFGISLGDVSSAIDLPVDTFKKLQKRLLDVVQDYFATVRDELYQRVCLEFGYCEQKKTRGWRIMEYLVGFFDVLVTNGGATLAMLALKTEVLDKLCGCNT